MEISEVGRILTLAASFDQRRTGESDVIAWTEVIGSLDFEDAKYAVLMHYRASSERIMPADVIRSAKAHKTARQQPKPGEMADALDDDIPDADPDDVQAYLRALREGRMRKYDDGTARPRPMRELTSDGFGYMPGDDE